MTKKMSDGIVRPRTVLDCVLHLQHHGTTLAIQLLEQTEPELANYLLETLTAIHQSLGNLQAPAAQTRRVYRQIKVMTLVCIEALRRSHSELWLQQIEGPAGPLVSDPPDQT
jgi:hypothetical protein